MRLVTVPERRPSILARAGAPHHCGSVRAEHDGEHVRALISVGDVCWTIKNVRTVEHPQRLMAGDGHRQIVACKYMPGQASRSLVPTLAAQSNRSPKVHKLRRVGPRSYR